MHIQASTVHNFIYILKKADSDIYIASQIHRDRELEA
jgi:hypothetical protein